MKLIKIMFQLIILYLKKYRINSMLFDSLKLEVITNNVFTYVKQYDWNVIGKKYLCITIIFCLY